MSNRKPATSEAELEVLKVLWKEGPSTVRQVDNFLKEQGKRWAYNTILTFLRRLCEKGYVETTKDHSAHVFTATVTQQQLLKLRLQDLVEQVCDNATLPLMHALLDSTKLTEDEVTNLRRLLDRNSESPGESES